jgi:hypothetical protein
MCLFSLKKQKKKKKKNKQQTTNIAASLASYQGGPNGYITEDFLNFSHIYTWTTLEYKFPNKFLK